MISLRSARMCVNGLTASSLNSPAWPGGRKRTKPDTSGSSLCHCLSLSRWRNDATSSTLRRHPPSPPPSASPTPSIPDPELVFEQRLTGLSILSRTHQFAQAGDVIEGTITVNWEGELNLDVRAIDTSKTDLDIRFDLTPFPLDQRIEGIGEFAMSTADIPYMIILPADECNPELGLTQNCFDPILHTVPLEFEFERDGQVYEASTEVFVDGRPIPLDIVQLQIILLFMVLIASAVFGRFIRNRARGSTRRTKTKKKKFKKKFDSS